MATKKAKRPRRRKTINKEDSLTENGKLKILKTSEYLKTLTKGED